jgi:hypothetical protein
MTWARWRRSRLVPVVAAAALALGLGLVVAPSCTGDDDESGGGSGGGTSTTMATGGVEIATPDGWLAVPLPGLGFGVAVPGGWEATRLDAEGLSSTGQASPLVPGFVEAAHNAAQTGSVFYAAGVDDQGRVTDLKVRAEALGQITDAAGLQAYATQAVAGSALDPTVAEVPEATYPTMQSRFQATSQRQPEGAPEGEVVDVTVEVTERLVLSPSGVVYSFIVTSEDAAGHDALAEQIFATAAFIPAPSA